MSLRDLVRDFKKYFYLICILLFICIVYFLNQNAKEKLYELESLLISSALSGVTLVETKKNYFVSSGMHARYQLKEGETFNRQSRAEIYMHYCQYFLSINGWFEAPLPEGDSNTHTEHCGVIGHTINFGIEHGAIFCNESGESLVLFLGDDSHTEFSLSLGWRVDGNNRGRCENYY